MKRRFQYDYYMVDVPGDLADNMKSLAEQAILEAKERAKLYCVPAVWTAATIKGELGDFAVYFRVCRKRIRKAA